MIFCWPETVPFILSFLGILAIGLINEALDEGDTRKTLQALQIPAAKLEGVTPKVAQHYQDTLIRAKREKAQVSAIKQVSAEFFVVQYILLCDYGRSSADVSEAIVRPSVGMIIFWHLGFFYTKEK